MNLNLQNKVYTLHLQHAIIQSPNHVAASQSDFNQFNAFLFTTVVKSGYLKWCLYLTGWLNNYMKAWLQVFLLKWPVSVL